jgi:ATP-dependent exoDNAse (exonuclease V) beta subunit
LSEPGTLGDEETRELIRTGLDLTQFVEAGAGTGKTTALVARVLELVCSGTATLGHIAAITFTEAAAAELRDRVYEALERVAGGSDGAGDPSGDGAADRRARARAALDEIDGAAISTLHGFAQRILTTHPFEAGLPPVFDVLDEGRSALAFDDRWDGFVDRILDDPALEDALGRLVVCGVTIPHLRKVAEQCNQNWDLLVHLDRQPPPLAPVAAAAVLGPLDEAARRSTDCVSADDLLARHLDGLTGFRSALHASGSELETLQLLVDAPLLTSKGGKAANWTSPVQEVRDLLAQAKAARLALIAGVASSALSNLMPAIRALTLEGAEARRKEGRLEFHDLLVWALELVRNRPDVRVQLHHEYQRLLIDEFQDTDPIQAELAVRIANGSGSDDVGVPWIDLPVEAGRLFFVGDPKQAIYRFRRADIGLFLAVRRRYLADRLALTDNFRSVPGILDWLNSVFGRLLGDGDEGVQPAYEALHPRRQPLESPTGGSPPVVLLGQAAGDGGVDQVRRAEAEEIALTIVRVRDEGWPVGPEASPARLSDMTVLLPARTGLAFLQEALDSHGIPYRLGASSLVYEAVEVSELLTLLRAVDDPTDQVSVVAALRSAYLGCGDDDLVAHRRAGGGWDYRAGAPAGRPDDDPVVEAMALLDELHRQRWWRDVSGLVELVLERCGLFELALDERRHRDLWRRLRFVADQARQFADAYGGDLRRFLAWVELQRRDDVRAVEVVLPEEDDDAVQVMTVHGAKGLEFPVVFLAGLSRVRTAPSDVSVLWGAEGPEVKIKGDLRTDGHAELAAREEVMERAQDLRLLYVAATRARDLLVVSLHHKVGSACHAATLAPLCEADPVRSRRLRTLAPTTSPTTSPAPPAPDRADRAGRGSADPADSPELRERWIEGRAELLAAGSRPRTLAASTVAALGREAGRLDGGPDSVRPTVSEAAKDDLDVDLPAWRRGRAGTSIGRAVHAVLQAVDLGTGAGLEDLSAEQAVAEGVVGREGEIAALVRAALGSDVITRAAAGGRYWRELYVGAPVGDGVDAPVVEGFIDLLVEGDDGFTVVDYKTDTVQGEEEIGRAAERYRLQGATYALALERALGRPVARCVFLFLRAPSVAEEREVPDLRSAMDEVVGLVGRVSPARTGPA